MIKGEIKKEIYFTNDVFREVSKRISVPENIIKEVFTDFIKDFKQNILETDYLFYELHPLGTFSINQKDLEKNIKKLSNKFYKEKDDVKREEFKLYLENFRVREQRMRVEQEKFKVIYPEKFSQVHLKREKNSMFKPSKFDSYYYNNHVKLKEAAELQNKYAYNWYKSQNKPVNH
jgi:hypothetical protein